MYVYTDSRFMFQTVPSKDKMKHNLVFNGETKKGGKHMKRKKEVKYENKSKVSPLNSNGNVSAAVATTTVLESTHTLTETSTELRPWG